jgi:hypothetical protein
VGRFADAGLAAPASLVVGAGAAPITPTYAFNPFDQSTWNVQSSSGSNVDLQA